MTRYCRPREGLPLRKQTALFWNAIFVPLTEMLPQSIRPSKSAETPIAVRRIPPAAKRALAFSRQNRKIGAHAPRTELPQVRTPHVALSLLAQQLPHRTPPLCRLRIRRHSPAHSLQADQHLPDLPLRRHAPSRRKPQLHLTVILKEALQHGAHDS